MGAGAETEFPEERKSVIINLAQLEWHTQNLLCPFCMEKHESLITGLASEIAAGHEGDQETYRKIATEYSKEIDLIQKSKHQHGFPQAELDRIEAKAREWRRILQGVTGSGHSHVSGKHTDIEHEEHEHIQIGTKKEIEHITA